MLVDMIDTVYVLKAELMHGGMNACCNVQDENYKGNKNTENAALFSKCSEHRIECISENVEKLLYTIVHFSSDLSKVTC